jgi:GDP-mannose 6-dehydrogenase
VNSTANLKTIAVFGLGYVGSVTAACFAQLGHRVFGVDKDEIKLNHLTAGNAPFYEPGLQELIAEAVAAGRLTATRDSAAAIDAADIVLICVGTPSAANGNLGLEQLERVFAELKTHLVSRPRRLIVAVRSTVFPGTIEQLGAAVFGNSTGVALVSCPEFLREGTAVRDFQEPSLVVVGGSDPAAVQEVAGLFDPLAVEVSRVSLRTAEMIKYCCNAFHALKIAFANEVGALAESLDVSPEEVMGTLCQDVRLNISKTYLKPGFAFGGSCLPKDLRALTYRAIRMDLKLPLLESVLPSNERHLERAVEMLMRNPARRIGIFGLAFKENTDDLRESPIISAIEQWTGKGRDVRIFDPHIQLESIYGSNRSYLVNCLPHISRLLAGSVQEMLDWCDCVVIAQKPSPEIAQLIARRGKPVFDLVRAGVAPDATAAAPRASSTFS